ncbi:class I SAM-dependent methyltransferase [Desulfovibrio sp. OttesenSCG-928-F20]|nr:class I SAM-dependent methyltransferase [Desulfovibrio sp. OttesenSCG-928-F20]
MGFYEQLSLHYDELFPVSGAEMAFVQGILEPCQSIIDLGCGTGNKSLHLAGPGKSVLGLDLDLGMIERARAQNQLPGMEYRVMDMALAPAALAPGSFDGALCLGNSMVHLDGGPAIEDFLVGMAALLRPGSPFVIQILNYDRIISRNIRSLPPLESAHVIFERRYEDRGDRLLFVTTLCDKESGESWQNAVTLYPLGKNEFATLLKRAGFSRTDWYGGYDGSPLTDDSFALIAVSRTEPS